MKKATTIKKYMVPKKLIEVRPQDQILVAIDPEDGFVQAAKFSKTHST